MFVAPLCFLGYFHSSEHHPQKCFSYLRPQQLGFVWPMDIAEYRREYRLSQTSRVANQLQTHQQSSINKNPDEIGQRFAHLWTREAINELTLKLEELSPHQETERAARSRLLGYAQHQFIDSQTIELQRELQSCQQQARFNWREASLSASDALTLIGQQKSEHERRELEARRLEALRSCDDLRAERFEREREASCTLGFNSRQELNNALTGVSDLSALVRAAEKFLAQTASSYQDLLRRIAAQLKSDVAAPLTYADYQFWRQTMRAGKFGRLVQQAFHETLFGLGIRPAQQNNLRVEKGSPATNCFPLDAPHKVVFATGPTETVALAARFFYEGARAQHFAWSSADLAERYPEFIYTLDCATNQSYGFLFNYFLEDENWMREHSGFHREDEVSDAMASYAFLHLHHVRRACAGTLLAHTLAGSESFSSEQAGESYAALYTEATGFTYHPAQYLSDVEALSGETMFLRAWGFTANLQEYFRSRYGRSWWTRRAAGDELIDLWNTASRYHVEELAQQLGTGELDYELLAENFINLNNRATKK